MWDRFAESAPASRSLILEKKSIRVVPQGSGGGSALFRRDSILLCWFSCIVLTGELKQGREVAMVLPSKRKAHVCFLPPLERYKRAPLGAVVWLI